VLFDERQEDPMDVTLKSFTDSGCNTFLVGCARTGEALLVDPKAGKGAIYRRTAAAFGLDVVAVLDTHTHADHLSGSAEFVREGVALWMSARTGCNRRHRALVDGEEVRVGELRFTALEVPGHTSDSLALAGHGLALTGDSLLVGGLGRADFRGSDPARLFESVRARLLPLPDETVVLPGHNYRDILFTTIGHERLHNPALRFEDGAAYARALNALEGAGNSPDVDATLATNLEADPQLPEAPGVVAACCAAGGPAVDVGRRPAELKVEEIAPRHEALTAEGRWYDVRDPFEYREGHIPGVLSYPLSELGFHIGKLRREGPVVLSCRSGVRSMTAARTLAYLGVLDQPINLAGGILRWQEAGLPVERGGARP
jgi:glyoxylase-like metal-dependent hydrolase (beta-lactamase superfamily II)/rhodanese-related sulfurtransferase